MIFFLLLCASFYLLFCFYIYSAFKKTQHHEHIDRRALNVDIAKERLDNLVIDDAISNDVNTNNLRIAQDEIKANLVDDLTDLSDDPIEGRSSTSKLSYWVVILCTPLLLGFLYIKMGDARFIDSKQLIANTKANQNQQLDHQNIDALIDKLESHLKQKPDDAKGWSLAAQTYYSIGNVEKTLHAFNQLNTLTPNSLNAVQYTAWANTLMVKNNQVYTPDAAEKLSLAIGKDPQHIDALISLVIGEMSLGHFNKAKNYISRIDALSDQHPDLPDMVNQLTQVVNSRQNATNNTQLTPANNNNIVAPNTNQETSNDVESNQPIQNLSRLEVSVDVDDKILAQAQQINPNSRIFIIIKSPSQRPPVAVKAFNLEEMPLTTLISDNDTMIPGQSLTNFDELTIHAKISLSGSAITTDQERQFESQLLNINPKSTPSQVSLLIENEK